MQMRRWAYDRQSRCNAQHGREHHGRSYCAPGVRLRRFPNPALGGMILVPRSTVGRSTGKRCRMIRAWTCPPAMSGVITPEMGVAGALNRLAAKIGHVGPPPITLKSRC